MIIVSRKESGLRAPRYVNRGTLSERSTVHWNGPTITLFGSTVWEHRYCSSLVRGIQNFHMDGRGWSDIAYNFLVCPHSYVFEGRGLNIINGANGTNTGNRSSHAICVLAGENNPFPEAEKMAIKDCVNYIANKALTSTGAIGHRDHKATACPGNSRYTWIHQGMPISAPPTLPIIEKEKDMFVASNRSGHTWLFEPGRRTLVPAADLDNLKSVPSLGRISDTFFELLTRDRARVQ